MWEQRGWCVSWGNGAEKTGIVGLVWVRGQQGGPIIRVSAESRRLSEFKRRKGRFEFSDGSERIGEVTVSWFLVRLERCPELSK